MTTDPRIAMIVATSRNGVIGRGGDLPWRQSADLKWFKAKTLGKPVVMGRKTFESIGRPLPGRPNIVITRREDFVAEGVDVVQSITEGFSAARAHAERLDVDEICLIGGAEIYQVAIAQVGRIYLTVVDTIIAPFELGDAFMPSLIFSDWRAELLRETPADAKNDHNCKYFQLDRVSS